MLHGGDDPVAPVGRPDDANRSAHYHLRAPSRLPPHDCLYQTSRGSTMARTRRIGILTGGGDVPGLNGVIKSVTYRASELGYEVVGIRRGWEGLTHQRRTPELDPEYA